MGMEILRGLPLPATRDRVTYDFDALKHGDAIRVTSSVASCREMFRRWRRKHPDRAMRLVPHDDPLKPNILFFIEDKPDLRVKRAPKATADVL